MTGYWLLLAILAPFVVAGGIAFFKGSSLLALLWMGLGMMAGAVLMPMVGTLWASIFSPDMFESQGGGILYIAIFLPFCIFLGMVTGAWSVAMGFWLQAGSANLALAQILGLVGSILLAGLLPWPVGLLLLPLLKAVQDNAIVLGTVAIADGILSAVVTQGLMAWLVLRQL
jgi:hypothetical protein